MNKIRLQAALAQAGIASRRKAAEIITSGRVKVNERFVKEKGFRVDISKDKISFDGRPLYFRREKHYFVLNKPTGVLSTVKDEYKRCKVSDFIKEKALRIYPVGRLDKNTTGLIILTDDGELAYRLTHPKFGVERVYEVKIKGAIDNADLRRLKDGLLIDGKLARAKEVLFKKKFPHFAVILVTLSEGRKREVRKMFEVLGSDALQLKRISYGPLKLKGLKEGLVRPLTGSEVKALKRSVGLFDN